MNWWFHFFDVTNRLCSLKTRIQIQKKLTLGNVVKMKWSPMRQRVPRVAAGSYLAVAFGDTVAATTK